MPIHQSMIVGIHFFPLAALFKVRTYHLTGAILCVLALVTLLASPETRLALAGAGIAATLFVTSAYMLFVGGKALRAGEIKG